MRNRNREGGDAKKDWEMGGGGVGVRERKKLGSGGGDARKLEESYFLLRKVSASIITVFGSIMLH